MKATNALDANDIPHRSPDSETHTVAITRVHPVVGFSNAISPLCYRHQGIFSAPVDLEQVDPGSSYNCVWNPALLKYFVDGDGEALGEERVSDEIIVYLRGNDNSGTC